MNDRINLHPFLLDHTLAAQLPVDERVARLIVRAFSHVMEMVLRNNQAFVLPDCAFGTETQVDAIDRWEAARDPSDPWMFDTDGLEVAAAICLSPAGDDDWLVTLADMWSLIVDRAREADPTITDSDIEQVIDSICEALASDGRHIDLPRVAPEADIEDWLVDNLEELAYTLDVEGLVHADLPRRGRQYRFRDGSRADIICRITEPGDGLPAGTWVVIELKAGHGDAAGVDQLARYIEFVEDELAADDEPVIGVLIADGFDDNIHHRIRELDAAVVATTLTACGYYEHRYREQLAMEAPTEADTASEDLTLYRHLSRRPTQPTDPPRHDL